MRGNVANEIPQGIVHTQLDVKTHGTYCSMCSVFCVHLSISYISLLLGSINPEQTNLKFHFFYLLAKQSPLALLSLYRLIAVVARKVYSHQAHFQQQQTKGKRNLD